MADKTLTLPFTGNDVAVTFGADGYADQFAKVLLTPNTPKAVNRTVSGKRIPSQGTTDWTLDLTAYQDADSASGFQRYALANEGETVAVTITPTEGANPITVNVLIAPMPIGGQPGADLQSADVSLMCVDAPVWAVV